MKISSDFSSAMRLAPCCARKKTNDQEDTSKEDTSNISFQGMPHKLLEAPNAILKENKLIIKNAKSIIEAFAKKLGINKEVPIVAEAIILCSYSGIQSAKDFLAEYAKDKLNRNYVSPNIDGNAAVLSKLIDERVINSSGFNSVSLYNGLLSDSTYKELREKIKNAPNYKLTNIQKRDLLNTMAKSNYHLEDVSYGTSFKSNADGADDNTNNDIDIDDDHESLWDAFLDMIDEMI